MTYDNPTIWAFAAAGALYGMALHWHSVESQWWLTAHGAMHVVVATGMGVAANTVAAR